MAVVEATGAEFVDGGTGFASVAVEDGDEQDVREVALRNRTRRENILRIHGAER
jgi:hypothetical protein